MNHKKKQTNVDSHFLQVVVNYKKNWRKLLSTDFILFGTLRTL